MSAPSTEVVKAEGRHTGHRRESIFLSLYRVLRCKWELKIRLQGRKCIPGFQKYVAPMRLILLGAWFEDFGNAVDQLSSNYGFTIHFGAYTFPYRGETCLTLSKLVLHSFFDGGIVCLSTASIHSPWH